MKGHLGLLVVGSLESADTCVSIACTARLLIVNRRPGDAARDPVDARDTRGSDGSRGRVCGHGCVVGVEESRVIRCQSGLEGQELVVLGEAPVSELVHSKLGLGELVRLRAV